jgi:excisionase family DNA binding protein
MQFYTVTELERLLKLSKSQVYALIRSGRLACYRLTTGKQGCVRVSDEQLKAYLKRCEEGDEGPKGEADPPLQFIK